MLSLEVKLGSLNVGADGEDGRTHLGGTRLDPFRSPHIVSSVVRGTGVAIAWVGEEPDPLSGVPERRDLAAYRTVRGLEGVAVLLRWGSPLGSVAIARTASGGCPIFVSVEGDVLNVSWRFEEVALALSRRRPDVGACRRYLEHGTGPVRDMVIAGVYMLWPGEALRFDAGGLVFSEVEEPSVVLSGSLSSEARVTEEFTRLIGAGLERKLSRSISPLIEVSGGMDSSCVAVAVSALRKPLCSYGLIHAGAMGEQQRVRRRELAKLCELRDAEFPSSEIGPFASLALPESSLTPFDDIFRSACTAGVKHHPEGPFDLVVTGIGGDELTMENTFFRRDWEVRGHAALSSISAAASRSDMFMRMGIWVANPLTHPDVIDFCRALPERLRKDRTLNILTLARAGLSDGFLFHRFQEHYGNMVQHEAALHDHERALDGSLVAAYGISDPGPLLAQAYEAGYGGFSYDLITKLFLHMKLDAVLKRYVN